LVSKFGNSKNAALVIIEQKVGGQELQKFADQTRSAICLHSKMRGIPICKTSLLLKQKNIFKGVLAINIYSLVRHCRVKK
jgi:hypothetical protein